MVSGIFVINMITMFFGLVSASCAVLVSMCFVDLVRRCCFAVSIRKRAHGANESRDQERKKILLHDENPPSFNTDRGRPYLGIFDLSRIFLIELMAHISG